LIEKSDTIGRLAKRFRYISGFHHQLAGFLAGAEFHLGRAGPRDLVRPLLPQALQPPPAPLVALAPRRDAFGRPAALGLDQPVQLVALHVLFVENLVAPFLEGLEALRVLPRYAAIHPDR